MAPSPSSDLSQTCHVYAADAFRVDVGAGVGEPLGAADTTVVGDVYTLRRRAPLSQLVLHTETKPCTISVKSELGTPGTDALVMARHALMSDRGAMVEILVIALGDARVLLPLGALNTDQDYTLMSSDALEDPYALSNVASVSFTRGTHVTMAKGEQIPVEELRVGDRVLTRDHGPQPIRWIGRQMVRAEGQRATVVIPKGALNNAGDLVLSPDHRLFIYQRRDMIGVGRAEVLVRARHLVDHETIYMRDAGTVEYFHLLFDNHEIIYVEGIPAESLLVAPEVLEGLDEDLSGELLRTMGKTRHRPLSGAEPSGRHFSGIKAADILRKASAARSSRDR